jgi:tripartite ATP-independent transporter DctM subunit
MDSGFENGQNVMTEKVPDEKLEGQTFTWPLMLARALSRFLKPASNLSIASGAIALIGGMLLIVVDVILRATLHINIPGAIELVKVLLVIIFFSGMAYTQMLKDHVRVDVLVNKFSPTTRAAITASADLVALGIISIISWQSVVQGQYEWTTGSTTGLLEVPLWPFAMITAVFMALFALAVLIDLLESLGDLASHDVNIYLWMAPGFIITIVLFGMSFFPETLLPFSIEPHTFGGIALLLMFGLIFFHVHIGAAMATVVIWGMGYLTSPEAGLGMLGMTSLTTASNYVFSVLPLFMWMGLLVAAAQFSRDIYMTAYRWLGHLPGGLASASVGACGAFAAVVGDPMSGAVTMSTVALPEMKKYKYDERLSTGAIAAGSTIGVLIPPSLSFIIYGVMVEQSVGKLFMAGIIPGIIVTLLFILMITVRCHMNPQLGPAGPRTTMREKIVSLKSAGPVLILFLLVIGGIYAGVFSATEAGAIGAFCAAFIGLVMKRISFKSCFENAKGAVKMAGLIFFIFIYATALTQFFALTKLPFTLAEILSGLEVSRYITVCLVLSMYLLLGCVMNGLPVIILTLPFVFPTMMKLGFDPIWFGVMVTMMVEIATITPPIGITVFAISGITKVPMYTIFRGVTPFWMCMLFAVALFIIFPQIVLFLPNLMMGG